ncbi:taste receptor type 2 member 40-like [Bombina bombina]|uniref:taste receptor type 2 member 40-like n=1 Tax=Bombina bombina TaxID=8345 RepID=UPI00235AF69A|nr:taste receptor type 2 member 40-like [Bombina bombina]
MTCTIVSPVVLLLFFNSNGISSEFAFNQIVRLEVNTDDDNNVSAGTNGSLRLISLSTSKSRVVRIPYSIQNNLHAMEESGLRVPEIYTFVFFTICIGEVIAGIVTSSFIVCVYLFHWYKGVTLSSCDQIIFALSISNVLYPFVSTFRISTELLHLPTQSIEFSQVCYGISVFTVMSSSWLSALLCLFYCVKIVHFKAGSILRLKMKIDVLVPWLILSAELVSLFFTIPGILSFSSKLEANKTSLLAPNNLINQTDNTFSYTAILVSLAPNIFFPFLITICTTVCIIWTLRKHTGNMRKNMRDSDSLKVHRTAVNTMLSLLFIFLSFYIAEIYITIDIHASLSIEYFGMVILMLASFPLQSLVLVLGTNKLMQNCKKLFQFIFCKTTYKSRPDTSP